VADRRSAAALPQAGRRVLHVRRHQRRAVADGFRTSLDFADALLEESRVAVTPGEAFDAPGTIRISYATSMEPARGQPRLLEFVAQHAPQRPRRAERDWSEIAETQTSAICTAVAAAYTEHGQGRRRHRRVEQSPQVRQPRAARVPQQGYTVVPINPHETEVEGLKAYASVLDVPGPIDMASLLRAARDRRAGHRRNRAEGDAEVGQPGAEATPCRPARALKISRSVAAASWHWRRPLRPETVRP
jgi:hypothetical protein